MVAYNPDTRKFDQVFPEDEFDISDLVADVYDEWLATIREEDR
jgi:hypothetical protein